MSHRLIAAMFLSIFLICLSNFSCFFLSSWIFRLYIWPQVDFQIFGEKALWKSRGTFCFQGQGTQRGRWHWASIEWTCKIYYISCILYIQRLNGFSFLCFFPFKHPWRFRQRIPMIVSSIPWNRNVFHWRPRAGHLSHRLHCRWNFILVIFRGNLPQSSKRKFCSISLELLTILITPPTWVLLSMELIKFVRFSYYLYLSSVRSIKFVRFSAQQQILLQCDEVFTWFVSSRPSYSFW